MSEVGVVVFEPVPIQRLDRGATGPMQQAAALGQHRVVGHLLSQRVLECILKVAGRRLLIDELRKLQFIEYPVDLIVGLLDDLAYERERKLLADHGQGLQ
jgi:hypothetical protein